MRNVLEDPADSAFSQEEEYQNSEESPFVCVTCQASFDSRHGKCPMCNAWGSVKARSELKEEDDDEEDDGEGQGDSSQPDLEDVPEALPIHEIETEHAVCLPTGIGELDRVLGGGAILGGATLVGGDPGVGKSTLLLQALGALSHQGILCLYATGEETADQVARRGRRVDGVDPDHLYLLSDQRVEVLLHAIEKLNPQVVVIDSVQTIYTQDVQNRRSMQQMQEVTSRIVTAGKRLNFSVFLVAHVTKDGVIAGPKYLEHLVDTVLAFEGEKGQAFRTLRAHKNRFGNALETGIFEMTETGMQEVPNASEFFLAERSVGTPGSIIAASCEDSRSVLVEVQALVSLPKVQGSRVSVTGVESKRVAQILAVLEAALLRLKQKKILATRDIYVNLAGGLSLSEPALDLPIALALASSLLGVPIHPSLMAFGEVGLQGEIRSVPRFDVRINEASSMGFEGALLPQSVAQKIRQKAPKKGAKKTNLDLYPVRTLDDALKVILKSAPTPRRGK